MADIFSKPEKIAAVTAIFLIGIGIVQIIFGEGISKSVALTANGIDCIGDGFVSSVVWVGLKFFSRPADRKFHYGYYKIENLATIAAAVVMIFLAVFIIYRSYNQFTMPHDIELPVFGAVLAFTAGLGALILGIIKFKHGKAANLQSVRLEAFNTVKDAAASFLTVTALILAGFGFTSADAIVGFIIAGIILSIGFAAMKEASLMLVDACDGQCIDQREAIGELAADHKKVKSVRIVKLRRMGPITRGDLEIALPGNITQKEIDTIKSDIQRDLEAAIPNIDKLSITTVAYDNDEVDDND